MVFIVLRVFGDLIETAVATGSRNEAWSQDMVTVKKQVCACVDFMAHKSQTVQDSFFFSSHNWVLKYNFVECFVLLSRLQLILDIAVLSLNMM